MDVDESELLEYLNEDRSTRVIMVYLEGAANGPRLLKSLAEVTQHKPVVILKSGRTQTGKQATASHTGSLSGQDHIYDAVFAQTGAIRADAFSELIDVVRVFATQPFPKGNRLGVITTSGSLGALATDVAVTGGLAMPPLSRFTVNQVRDIAPDWMHVRNPLDLGPSQSFNRVLPMVLEDSQIDMVLAIMVIPYAAIRNLKSVGVAARDLYGDIASVRKQHPEKPLVGVVIGRSEFVEDIASLCGPSVPIFASPEPAAKALAILWRYSKTHNVCKGMSHRCH